MKKKVLVGMSGGVDSSVAAYLLKKEGYEVIGVTIKHWNNYDVESNGQVCCSIEDVRDAKRVCDKLGIVHYTVNFKENFKKEVVDYFIDEYSAGNTPSPCIICNEKIKFGDLLDFAMKVECDYISTGHYAKISKSEKYGCITLVKGEDSFKDQTYMLYRLSGKQLEKILFPLAIYSKKEIRDIAKENGIITHNKSDSQGICFAGEGYIKFLEESLGEKIKSGEFVNKDKNVIGEHKGYQIYTIGQRRGLGLNVGRPYFVIDILPDENRVVLGEYEDLKVRRVYIREWRFIVDLENLIGGEFVGRPRFSSLGMSGELGIDKKGVYFDYFEKSSQNARGQHIVFYDNEIVIGGGIII